MAAENQGGSRGSWTLLFLTAIASSAIGGMGTALLTRMFFGADSSGGISWGWIVAGVVVGTVIVVTVHYWMVLGYGAYGTRSRQRERYNRLRTELHAGGRAGAAYERILRRALDGVDRILGDDGEAERTLFPRAFGLRARAPLWTATSYDRCLLFAFVYPIGAIFIIWTASGHVGPAEVGLGLSTNVPAWRRGLELLSLLILCLSFVYWMRTNGWRLKTCAILAGTGAFVASSLLFVNNAPEPDSSSIGTLASMLIVMYAFLVGTIGIVASTMNIVGALGITWALVFPISTVIAVRAADLVNSQVIVFAIFLFSFLTASIAIISIGHLMYARSAFGRFLLIYSIVGLLFAVSAPWWLGSGFEWLFVGPMLLFLVVLTLVNAPFDWLTLGLTRALLRRGLELGGWWPLGVALLDLFAAAMVVCALSIATLWIVQVFTHFTILGGGRLVLEAGQVLEGLADPQRRTAPEYWWLYAMLFSTLIPSIVNVTLGALSILRGVPGLHARLAKRLPRGAAMLGIDRWWVALVLALQATLSLIAGFAVTLGLVFAIFIWALPLIGFNLVSMLQALAAQDLPGRLMILLGIG